MVWDGKNVVLFYAWYVVVAERIRQDNHIIIAPFSLFCASLMCDLVTYISVDLVTVTPLFCVSSADALVDSFVVLFKSISMAEIAVLLQFDRKQP
ncbi:hypothetical protein Zmor_000703 [Zophobas morio]|uniref:Uncharacterized protein n=1 Tax=Zophobas morio TaxID=2755281 RepID=A0AA38MQZ1_9CUCU|nr:hypothetical protein Zmor_000703 [Zophobas morio]